MLVNDCVVSDQIQSSLVSVGMLGSPVRDQHEKDKMPSCPLLCHPKEQRVPRLLLGTKQNESPDL